MSAEERIAEAFDHAGVEGWVHAIGIDQEDDEEQVDLGADEPVVAASIFKIPVLLELCRQAWAGEVDLQERVRLSPDDFRTPGGTGTAVMLDAVDLSVRDLALSMMTVSDNRATDVVLDLVGLGRVNATLAEAGLPGTYLEADCRGLFATMDEDLGGSWQTYLAEQPDGPALRTMRATTPLPTNRTTPRETTRLLGALWRDEVGPPEACAEARRILGLQVWPHRLASGFPEPSTQISGETGTLAHLRSEAAVVEIPGRGRFAVAVFVSAATAAPRNPIADRVIGTAARIAVDALG